MENDNCIENNIEKKEKSVVTLKMTPKISLEEKFAEYNGDNLAKEFSWDEPQGKDIW